MKKSILNLKGAQELTKNELKSVKGGLKSCKGSLGEYACSQFECCNGGYCFSLSSTKCRTIEFPG